MLDEAKRLQALAYADGAAHMLRKAMTILVDEVGDPKEGVSPTDVENVRTALHRSMMFTSKSWKETQRKRKAAKSKLFQES